MLSQEQIADLVHQVETALTAKSERLRPWFAQFRPRLLALAGIIGHLSVRVDADLPLADAAKEVLLRSRALVVRSYPSAEQWFATNQSLLALVALKAIQASHASKPSRSEQLLTGERLDALRARAILFPTELEPSGPTLFSELESRSDRIDAFLRRSGIGIGEGSDEERDSILLRLSTLPAGELAAQLSLAHEATRESQNRAILEAADAINDGLKNPSQYGAAEALVRLPSPHTEIQADDVLSALSSESPAAVAGFLSLARYLRPAAAPKFDAKIAKAGTLSPSWQSVSVRGEQLRLSSLPRESANLLLGQATARQLRIESDSQVDVVGQEPPDLATPAVRTGANLAAIAILRRGEPFTPADRDTIGLYSGWGGLSINKIRDKVPAEWIPEDRAVIHEYYTPTAVAESIARLVIPRLQALTPADGYIRALEPSAGIGRLIRAVQKLERKRIEWVACEYSQVSATLLRALLPEAMVFNESFEQFVSEQSEEFGNFQLVLSNPPYGVRGAASRIDRDKAYYDKRAWFYQMRRALQFLGAGGIAVFIIPAGFMTGRGRRSVEARRTILRTAHLMAAFRLPSETEGGRSLFPGALLVTDVVFLRARGGNLPEVDESDADIVAGNYFKQYPMHILGREVGRDADDDNQEKKPRFGYQVRGNFDGIPDFEERPLCRSCAPVAVETVKKRKKAPAPQYDQETLEALSLSRRISSFYSDIARGDSASIERARAGQDELIDSIKAWHSQDREIVLRIASAGKRIAELRPLLSAYKDGQVNEQLTGVIRLMERFGGDADDVTAIALFRFSSDLDSSLEAIHQYHVGIGGNKSASQIRTELLAGGFAIDENQFIPNQDYYSGSLWEKYDRALARAEAGDEVAAIQATKLLAAIRPAHYAELDLEPRLGWLPVKALTAFVRHYLSDEFRDEARYELARDEAGFLSLKDKSYDSLPGNAQPHLIELLGYLNHDLVYFKPSRKGKDESLDQARERRAADYREAFRQWIEASPTWQATVANQFNRVYRGWVPPMYPKEPLVLARWNQDRPLFGYQWSAIRRLNANHGGGLFFDVGLGKTRTILATLALARQQGWARRPVICVPNSVTFNWVAEIERVLPDFRVVIIGARRKPISRGARKGEIESETDTPAERAEKWQKFKSGLYDVAIVTYSSLARTQIRPETLKQIVRSVPAIRRQIGLDSRTAQFRIAQLEKKRFLTDEQRAELDGLISRFIGKSDITERKAAIIAEKEDDFIAQYSDLPAGQQFDPGIYWDDLGIDFIALDESHIAKNLWTNGPREGGSLKFLGAPQAASGIAFQVFFRCAVVRRNSGGRGVHLADATPAKNSPLEFLSLLSFIDDRLWERLGVLDAEQYVTQFLKIEKRLVTDTDLSVVEAPCVVGFKNLDQLREVLFRYGEFRTAAEVGLKIPKPEVYQLEVAMNDEQESKYATYISGYTSAISRAAHDAAEAGKALGLLAKMSLVAVHPRLDEPPDEGGWTYKNYREVGDFESPKLRKIADLIASRRNCGHLVFLENTVTHYWLREVLQKVGIDGSRIAILNGEVTASPLSRQRIAEDFTSESPKYDVVIANRVAYEGLNLQIRTCAIYHGDLPWEPATLQQRNGRGLRQGNKYDVIEIYYVLSSRSMDGARFELIRGKREWMAELVESAASETNNPAAQTNMSPEEWLIFLSRNKEQTRELIEARKAAIKAAADDRTAKLAWSSIRSIAIRQRDLRNADLAMRTRLMEDIYKLSEELQAVDDQAWPWKFILPYVTSRPVLSFSPKEAGAVWYGARFTTYYDGQPETRGEFGRVIYEPRQAIGYRRFGEVTWTELVPDEAQKIFALTNPSSWQAAWDVPIAEEIAASANSFIDQIRDEGVWIYKQARLDLATEGFNEFLATDYLPRIIAAISESNYAYQARLPILVDGQLVDDIKMITSASVIPFTSAGYDQFLAIAVNSSIRWSDLNSIAEFWWGRGIPRNFLSLADKQQQAA